MANYVVTLYYNHLPIANVKSIADVIIDCLPRNNSFKCVGKMKKKNKKQIVFGHNKT